jgi:hypothetical protein
LAQQNAYFVRSGALAANNDIKLYDVGNLFACSQNIATGGSTLGEIYVDYVVVLMTPQVGSSDASVDASIVSGAGGGMIDSLPFGNGPTEVSSLSTLFSYDSGTGNFTFLRSGQWLVAVNFVGTVITDVSVNGNVVQTEIASSGGTGGNYGLGIYIVNAVIGKTIQFETTATTISASSMRVAPYPYVLG